MPNHRSPNNHQNEGYYQFAFLHNARDGRRAIHGLRGTAPMTGL